MALNLNKIIDFDSLGRLFEAFHAATGIAVFIVTLDGKVCASAGKQTICADYYRRHPESSADCQLSETRLNAKLAGGNGPVVHRCPHGLINGAVPIAIDHDHVANLFTGKFFLEPPDMEAIASFTRAAKKWAFDENAYMDALQDVPIVPENRITATLQYLKQLAEIIGEMGLNRLKLMESERSIAAAQASLQKEINQRREETKKLAQILEGNPIPAFVIDADSRITHWNQACERLTGVPGSEMIGTDNHQQVYHPDRRPLMADLIVSGAGANELGRLYGNSYRTSRLIKDGYEGEAFFPKIGARGKWLFFTAAPIRNEDGNVIGAIETIQDITERHETEQVLRANETRYRQLFESANDGLFILKEGVLIDCNQKALELFDASWEAMIGQSPMVFSPEVQPDGRSSLDALQKYQALTLKGKRQYFDWLFIRKDMSLFDAEVSLTQLMIDDAPHVLAIVRDITERKKMIAALQEREKELAEKSDYLEKVNQALKASLDHREVEKRAVEENMLVNLKRFVFPYIEELGSCSINTNAQAYLNIIKTNLSDIVSRFSQTMFWKYQDLTPTEVQIADLIRSGKNTKNIAQMLSLSPSSVQWHRKNIREKLGLTNKKVNLQTYLASLSA